MNPKWDVYIQNAREAITQADFGAGLNEGFEKWYARRMSAVERLKQIRSENTRILNAYLFPCLDRLHSATEEELKELRAFADELLDWKTNLDPGIYTAIHDAMLSLYRVRRDRNAIIRELYKLGMGLYYQNRYVRGLEDDRSAPFFFRNEMVFTEAASYLRYFEEIDDEETRGYIVRSLANIALCTKDHKRKIAASSRVLKVIRDPYYRSLAPGLPWDRFEQSTHRQMSANRVSLSKGDLSREELSEVLDSCYEVFKTEQDTQNPGVRWLWPYYEMEYSCGYISREKTLERLEKLIGETPFDQYDKNGLYGNAHLPLVYGAMLKQYPELKQELKRVRFLNEANRKMCKTLLSFPTEQFGDDLRYTVMNVLNNYNETGCEISFKQIALRLMQRFFGELYILGRIRGELSKRLCVALLSKDNAFFDDIPFVKGLSGDSKTETVLRFAAECAVFCDIGLVKMGMAGIRTRGLLETENKMYLLHQVAGYEILSSHESTAVYADAALGHHSRYDGMFAQPGDYTRNSSPYRLMTDVLQIVSFIVDTYDNDMEEVLANIYRNEGTRFSPLVTSVLADEELYRDLERILKEERKAFYEEVYFALRQDGEES